MSGDRTPGDTLGRPGPIRLSANSPPLIGQSGKRYKLNRAKTLGEGGYGKVFACTDESSGKTFAVKMPLPDADSHDALRFELIWLLRLNQLQSGKGDPAVVEVIDWHPHEHDEPFIVLDRYEQNLAEWLESELSLRKRMRALLAFARAVHRFHELSAPYTEGGLVHKDLKPQNVLVRARDVSCPEDDWCPEVVLADLGVARQTEHTRTHSARGDPRYGPWEQFTSFAGNVPTSWDVHAVAATIFESVVGRLPGSVRLDPGSKKAPDPRVIVDRIDYQLLKPEGIQLQDTRAKLLDHPADRIANLQPLRALRAVDRLDFEMDFRSKAQVDGVGPEAIDEVVKPFADALFDALEVDYLKRPLTVANLVDALDEAILRFERPSPSPGRLILSPELRIRPVPPPELHAGSVLVEEAAEVEEEAEVKEDRGTDDKGTETEVEVEKEQAPALLAPGLSIGEVLLFLFTTGLAGGVAAVGAFVLPAGELMFIAATFGLLSVLLARLGTVRGQPGLARLGAAITIAAAVACIVGSSSLRPPHPASLHTPNSEPKP